VHQICLSAQFINGFKHQKENSCHWIEKSSFRIVMSEKRTVVRQSKNWFGFKEVQPLLNTYGCNFRKSQTMNINEKIKSFTLLNLKDILMQTKGFLNHAPLWQIILLNKWPMIFMIFLVGYPKKPYKTLSTANLKYFLYMSCKQLQGISHVKRTINATSIYPKNISFPELLSNPILLLLKTAD